MTDINSLTHEERMKLAVQAEMVLDLFAKKNGITVNQLVDTIKWVEKHRDWMESMKRGGALALIGFLASALLLALWEGLKQTIRRG